MQTRKIRGIQLSYIDKGNNHPILFIHGHPFDHSMWNPQINAFYTNHRVVVPDLRGYGKSDGSSSVVLLDEMALDLAILLDELNIEHTIVCGLSMGGQIALEFAHLFQHRIKHLIICASTARPETPLSYRQRLAMAEGLADDGMRPYCQKELKNFFSTSTFNNNKQVVEHVRTMILNTPPFGAAAANRGRAERRDYTPTLKNLKVPTLILVGDEDVFTPISEAKYMADHIQNSQLHIMPNVGHMPNLEAAKSFNKVFKTFIDG
ncbi:MAG: alpha/beta hydrolase [Chloroflexota bacterium]